MDSLLRRLLIVLLILYFWVMPVWAQFNFGAPGFNNQQRKQATALLDHEPTVEDILKKSEIETTYLPPVALDGLKLTSINGQAMTLLGQNYFVAINDPKRQTFAQIYRENRNLGRSNFVTLDSLVHPALAHHNRIVASVTENRLEPQLLSLLKAIFNASVSDYKSADDVSVQEDIERNLAFLAVAIKLLSPETKLAESDRVAHLVQADFDRILKETVAYSAVFKRQENFALYRPLGFYDTSTDLQNYYRCRQWLGRTYLLLSDITDEAGLGTGNEFRRAVLLFRSLSRAKFGESTGMKAWNNITNVIAILEPSAAATADGVLAPTNFESAFGTTDREFKATLEALSNPLSRARLFLTLKGKERPELNSKSVFELSRKNGKEHERMSFRLFPSISQPEMDWLAKQNVQHKDATEGFSNVPAALFFLHARGFRAATNVLADNTYRFDPALALALPALTKLDGVPAKNQSPKPPARTTWQIFEGYANSKPESCQSTLRVANWLSCCLESTIAAWVDSLTAIDPGAPVEKKAVKEASNEGGTPAVNQSKTSARPRFHYLEPVPDAYRSLSDYLENFETTLTQLGLFPEPCRSRNQDFIRLAKRFSDIAKRELANKPLDANDLSLLENIDQVYEQISFPVQGYIHLEYALINKETALASAKTPAGSNQVILRSRRQAGKGLESTKAKDTLPAENPLSAIDLQTPNSELLNGFELGKKQANQPAASPQEGMNMVLSGPASVDIILHGPKGALVARGGIYSFYEVPGVAGTEAQWSRKLEYGFLKPPFWCEPFQLVSK
jgi:hypothetical protein